MQFIGLDIGTTGCKAAVFNETGTLLGSASREYEVDTRRPNWAEQDSEKVWSLAQKALRDVEGTVGPANIASLGLSVQGEADIAVDGHGIALRPAILGMDTRTGEQNAWLRERFGAKHLFEQTGMPVHTINTLPKLLWLKQHEPDLWAGAQRFFLYEDFLIQNMTGRAVICRCLASRTQVFDITRNCWSSDIVESLDLEQERLAVVQPSGTVVGTMHSDLAESLGFVNPPLVVAGGHDQACGALGVGLVRPGLAMVCTGTAEVVEVALASPVLNQTLYEGNISVYAHTVDGLYPSMTLNHSGGLLLRWFRDTLGQEELRLAQESGRDAYDLLLADASPEPTRLLMLPHFAGSGTPTFDTESRGAILGLAFATGKTDMAKAILEGLTFELRLNLDQLRDGGVVIDELRAIGGGTRSELWLQLKADITGIPVVVPRITDAACWGAGLLAAQGAGCYASAAQAAEEVLQLQRRFAPNPTHKALYDEQYALYREVYPAVRCIHRRLQ